MPSAFFRSAALFFLFLLVAILFRLPAFLNSDALNSDHAVAALQARHILHGEWDWFLWGVGYQASLEPLLTALGFRFIDDSSLVFMFVAFSGYLLQSLFACLVLYKRLGVSRGFCASLFLLLLPPPLLGTTLYPPRQWCLTFVFAAVYLLDRAAESRRSALCFILALGSMFFSLYVDFFTISFLVPVLVLAGGCVWDGAPTKEIRRSRAGAIFVGFLLGGVFLALTRKLGPHGGAPLAIHGHVILKNAKLFFEQCLPGVLGYPAASGVPEEQYLPTIFLNTAGKWFRAAAAAILLGQAFLGGWLGAKDRSTPWPIRRLAIFGFLTSAASVTGFLLSPGVYDRHASRYLAPLLWTVPFTLGPVLYRLPIRRFLELNFAPLLVLATMGWFSYGPALKNGWPARSPSGTAEAERSLRDFLRSRGVEAAKAPYWLAYRLTYLFDENPIVTTTDPNQSRYRPYAERFDSASRKAFLFDETDAKSSGELEQSLRASGARTDVTSVPGFRVLVVEGTGR